MIAGGAGRQASRIELTAQQEQRALIAIRLGRVEGLRDEAQWVLVGAGGWGGVFYGTSVHVGSQQ